MTTNYFFLCFSWSSNNLVKIESAQQKAVISANKTLLDLYWDIGNVILNKKKEQGWGAKVIDTLSKDITSAFTGTKGYSSRNLKYMSQFAKTNTNFLVPFIRHKISY